MRLLLSLALLLATVLPARAGSVSLAWDPPAPMPPGVVLTGYQLQRCLVPPDQSTCTPQDLPGAMVGASATTYTDQAAPLGVLVYAVVALCTGCDGGRSAPSSVVAVAVGVPPPAPTNATAVALVPSAAITVTADSQETAKEDGRASNGLDGNPLTTWVTPWSAAPVPGYPHWLRLDLGQEWWVRGLLMTPRQDGKTNGMIADYRLEGSRDGQTWAVLASGTWAADTSRKVVTWPAALVRYVRLVALKEVAGNAWASAAEVALVLGAQP